MDDQIVMFSRETSQAICFQTNGVSPVCAVPGSEVKFRKEHAEVGERSYTCRGLSRDLTNTLSVTFLKPTQPVPPQGEGSLVNLGCRIFYSDVLDCPSELGLIERQKVLL